MADTVGAKLSQINHKSQEASLKIRKEMMISFIDFSATYITFRERHRAILRFFLTNGIIKE